MFTTTTGGCNVAMGNNALRYNTTGGCNTALGRNALICNTTASNNTAVGYQSLYSNTTGDYNTAIGYNTLCKHTTGSDNTAVGLFSQFNTTTGIQNASLGNASGCTLTTGSCSTFLGYNTQPSGATTSNEIVIGHTLTSQGAGYVTIGRNLGSDYIYNQFTVNASWTRASDERIKKDIETDTLGLDFINNLRPVHYRKKSGSELDPSLKGYDENDTKQRPVEHGFIAQEVKQALDDAGVDASKYGVWHQGNDGIQAISREMFIMPLVNAIKDLKKEIDLLKNK